jgi:hypothetical protein
MLPGVAASGLTPVSNKNVEIWTRNLHGEFSHAYKIQTKNKQTSIHARRGECTDFLAKRRETNGQRIGLEILKKENFPNN